MQKEKQRDVFETKSIYEKNAFIALLKTAMASRARGLARI